MLTQQKGALLRIKAIEELCRETRTASLRYAAPKDTFLSMRIGEFQKQSRKLPRVANECAHPHMGVSENEGYPILGSL